ncbi:MAG TPA: ABC transporter permease [Candidatus Saccharimonadia bacterium]|nr:ABC transporter permease [Candidatus Saccharimonadia bacterium]
MNLSNIFSHRNRALLRELVATEFKLRYQGSALGYLWSLIRPLFLFGILLFVFGFILKITSNIEHYPVYLLLGIVLWSFFVEATNNGLQSIVGRGDLIRKINFPKYIIVISGTISALINLGISLVVVFIFILGSGVEFRPIALLFPLIIVELYALALALAFFLSALYVKYRDITYIWELGLQAAFYATPILYPMSLVIGKSLFLSKVLMLNPMAQIVQDARYVLITPQTTTQAQLTHNWLAIAFPFAVVVLVSISAGLYFRSTSKYFAEIV